jgi:hypothetical protein
MTYITDSKKLLTNKNSSFSDENSIFGSAEKMTFSHKVFSGVPIL